MAGIEKEVNWNLTFRTALIMAAIGLVLFGVFGIDRIECKVCWQDLQRYYFSIFGFFAAFGFAIGWTLPEATEHATGTKHHWNTRQGFWEGSLTVGALLTCIGAVVHFLR